MTTIEISVEEYLSLYHDMLKLEALEGAGVDNWSGYDEVDWAGVRDELEAERVRVDA